LHTAEVHAPYVPLGEDKRYREDSDDPRVRYVAHAIEEERARFSGFNFDRSTGEPSMRRGSACVGWRSHHGQFPMRSSGTSWHSMTGASPTPTSGWAGAQAAWAVRPHRPDPHRRPRGRAPGPWRARARQDLLRGDDVSNQRIATSSSSRCVRGGSSSSSGPSSRSFAMTPPAVPPAEPAAVGQGLCENCARTLAIRACNGRQRDRRLLWRERRHHQRLRQRRASSVASLPYP